MSSANESEVPKSLDDMTLGELEAYHEALLTGDRDAPDYYARLLPVQLEIEKRKLIGAWGG